MSFYFLTGKASEIEGGICMSHVRSFLPLGILALIVFALAVVPVSAQTASTTTVTGVVFDKTGATVPQATVDLEDIDTKAKTSVTTGSDGEYTFRAVRPGNYTLTVSSKGFRQSVISGIKVDVGRSATVNVVLEVGGTTETVEVVAGAGLQLQTLDATVGDVLDSNMLSQ